MKTCCGRARIMMQGRCESTGLCGASWGGNARDCSKSATGWREATKFPRFGTPMSCRTLGHWTVMQRLWLHSGSPSVAFTQISTGPGAPHVNVVSVAKRSPKTPVSELNSVRSGSGKRADVGQNTSRNRVMVGGDGRQVSLQDSRLRPTTWRGRSCQNPPPRSGRSRRSTTQGRSLHRR